jgi:hypothetical protein
MDAVFLARGTNGQQSLHLAPGIDWGLKNSQVLEWVTSCLARSILVAGAWRLGLDSCMQFCLCSIYQQCFRLPAPCRRYILNVDMQVPSLPDLILCGHAALDETQYCPSGSPPNPPTVKKSPSNVPSFDSCSYRRSAIHLGSAAQL